MEGFAAERGHASVLSVTKDSGRNPADKDITGWKSCNRHTDEMLHMTHEAAH